MERAAKLAKAKIEARPPAARKSRTADGSTGRELEKRLTETLEQQAATSEILRVISSSRTDAQPVFDTIAANALRLCDARFSAVFRFDGELIHLAAFRNVTPEGTAAFRSAYPCQPSRGGTTQRAILTRSIVHMPDVLKDPEYVYQEAAERADFRSALSVPMLRDGEVIGTISVYRDAARPFPDAQIELLKTFADQAVIAVENVRLFTELQARNRELTDSLTQQTATAEILRVISGSPTDIQPVLDAVAESAALLCEAFDASIFRVDGDQLRLAAHHGPIPYGPVGEFTVPLVRGTIGGRTVLDQQTVHVVDVQAETEEFPEASQYGRRFGTRTSLSVPLMREGIAIGTIHLRRTEARLFTDRQIALLQTFADQAVIAIENVRLFNETKEALERQTATADILRVISGSPTDTQPVFEVILDRATKLCDAETGILFRYENGAYHAQATRIPNAEFAAMFKEPRRPGPGSKSGLGRLMREKRTVHIPDLLQDVASAEGDPLRLQTLRGGVRTWLGVPLLKEGELIGAILVYRSEPRAFGEHQISLLETFADQAVIAIENVRLFNETKEALEQQTASAEILKVISGSPTDVQPVFEAIVQSGVRLFEGAAVAVVRPEGGEVRLMAIAEADRERAAKWASRFPNPLNRDYMHGAAILDCAMVDVPDALQAQDRFVEGRRNFALTGYRAVTVAPMVRDKFAIGAISVVRIAPGPLSEKQKALLRTFADQAVIAIENVRLFKELQARTEALTRSVGQLTALGEVGQAISSTLDLETVLKTIVSRAVQLTGLDGGSIYEYDDRAEEFRLQAAENMPQDVAEDIRKAPTRKGDGALGRTAVTLEPTQVPDTLDGSYQSARKELLIRAGYRALLAVPLLREDHLLGGLLVNRKTPGAFAPEIVELLKTFATQSALAIQNARLFREIEEKGGQLEAASRHKSEFLANMSHELRTPLNAIIGFSEVLSERMFGEINDKQAEYLGDILESGRHLLSLINDILDLSKIEAGRMELDPTDFDLPTAIENTLILVRERAHRRGISLGRTVDECVGMIRADERKVKQVLLNLLSNALKFTPEGGQIDVRARVYNGEAEISVADTGEGIAPEDQEAVFEEFRQVGTAAKKVEGTGLGLAISRKFIELHGGRIWVKSQLGIGSTFAFTLPLTIV